MASIEDFKSLDLVGFCAPEGEVFHPYENMRGRVLRPLPNGKLLVRVGLPGVFAGRSFDGEFSPSELEKLSKE